MPRDIDIALLRAFLAVVETGGVTNAARILNRTQAAVSLQIKRLEELFGTELFQRERKRFSLSPAGERLFGSAQRLVALNDATWGAMTTPQFEGEVRLGVPPDIVTSLVPPVLQRFSQSWPRINVSLVCKASTSLMQDLADRKVDLIMTTEISCGPMGEALLTDRLVWVGGPGSDAHLQRPLPVSLGTKLCLFRPEVIKALHAAQIDWRPVSQDCNMEPVYATLKAGLAVAPLMRTAVPEYLEILCADAGLPPLPDFMVNLYLPASASEIARELARHIRQGIELRFGPSRGRLPRRRDAREPAVASGARNIRPLAGTPRRVAAR
ncbi:MAG: LysR family transcriptional regulator [Hyphomicrobiaceae bacterium]|nr:LysR family transcriptional regulator [Hyphomicrobiaceae bacterium]